MHRAMTAGLAGLVLSLLLGTTAAGRSDEDSAAQLREELAELKTRVRQLQAKRRGHWLNEARAAEIRGLVQDVLADSDARNSLQSQAATAGYDRGFFIGSAADQMSFSGNRIEQGNHWLQASGTAAIFIDGPGAKRTFEISENVFLMQQDPDENDDTVNNDFIIVSDRRGRIVIAANTFYSGAPLQGGNRILGDIHFSNDNSIEEKYLS